MNDVIDSTAVVVADVQVPTLYGTDNPQTIIERATAQANVLAKVIESKGLYKQIGPKKHVRIEGWTTCGALVGVFAVPVWTKPIMSLGTPDGWEARVEARTMSGQLVGAAEAECLYAERNWSDRDDYALRSMAQTRAASKALRLPLGWIVTLAGFDATPAEEMPHEPAQRPQGGQQRPTPPAYNNGAGKPSEAQASAIHKMLGKLKQEAPDVYDTVVAGVTLHTPGFIGADGKPTASALTGGRGGSASALIDMLSKALDAASGKADPDDLPFTE